MPNLKLLCPIRLLLTVVLAAVALAAAGAQSPFLPVSEIKPGMIGVGRSDFGGDQLGEFRAHILGVLRNTVAPGRDLILARLEGGPLASTGVMQGMSGSPVYVDHRLIGAVSYSLGTFPKEAIAGITPIAEMIAEVNSPAPRAGAGEFDLTWPATPARVFASLGRVVARASAPLRSPLRASDIVGAASLADWVPQLRPIGAAMVASGLAPDVESHVRQALEGGASLAIRPAGSTPQASGRGLQPGDPIGMSFMRGDLEMGATGTVTYIDGTQVYAFGHPFLNQGPTSMPMTRARVLTILPSLDTSMKITSMGPVIGRMTQDRSTAVGGVLGPGPDELEVTLTLESPRAPARRLQFNVLHDQSLTPLFAYVAILNALTTYERQSTATSITAHGTVDFAGLGTLAIDDAFTGDQATALAAASVMTPIGAMATNTFQPALPEKLDLTLRISNGEDHATIERIWLDTTRPTLGGTHTLHVMLRRYRGGTEVISLPITMPLQASGPVTVLVTDGPGLLALEQKDLRPVPPASIADLFARLREHRSSNRLYVRILDAAGGTAVAGESMPSLPASVLAALNADASVASTPLSRAIVGAWDRLLPRVVRGSRELTLTLRPVSPSSHP